MVLFHLYFHWYFVVPKKHKQLQERGHDVKDLYVSNFNMKFSVEELVLAK